MLWGCLWILTFFAAGMFTLWEDWSLSALAESRADGDVPAIHITWEFTPLPLMPAPVRFTLYRSIDDQVTWSVLHNALAPEAREYRDTALVFGRRYCYQVSVGYPPSPEVKKSRSKKYEPAPQESAPYFLGCQQTPPAPPLPPVHGGAVRFGGLP